MMQGQRENGRDASEKENVLAPRCSASWMLLMGMGKGKGEARTKLHLYTDKSESAVNALGDGLRQLT